MSSRWVLLLISLMLIVGCVSARTHHDHHHRIKPLKYSYGIYAPTGWTVALYIWYIVKLGFILGALLLLLFAKKWNTNRQPIVFERRPEYYHHRSLDTMEPNLFHPRSRRDVRLYWNDRIDTVRSTLR